MASYGRGASAPTARWRPLLRTREARCWRCTRSAPSGCSARAATASCACGTCTPACAARCSSCRCAATTSAAALRRSPSRPRPRRTGKATVVARPAPRRIWSRCRTWTRSSWCCGTCGSRRRSRYGSQRCPASSQAALLLPPPTSHLRSATPSLRSPSPPHPKLAPPPYPDREQARGRACA